MYCVLCICAQRAGLLSEVVEVKRWLGYPTAG